MDTKPQQHLINILLSTKDHHPNFTLFLGAGASVTSGIKGGSQLIKEWRSVFSSMYGEKNLKEQPWFDKSNEYSELFERLYDQPTQRREFIENCIVQGAPSWGYVYLVNLLKLKHFNTIFTTNFDDLINEACYTFSNNLRPVVCAHDSSIKSIRLTSNRPKIIKLHGDFLFDNIKNTIRELESLEDNMRAKFRQYANEFGMIVVGYAGNDRSIMDTLNTLLHSDSCFPHGIYWCIRKGTVLSDELNNLARFPRFHLIEITGFDDFMAELHNALGCKLQDEVTNPYFALARKLDKYFPQYTDPDETDNDSEIIKADMNLLATHVRRVDAVLTSLKELSKKVENLEIDLPPDGTTNALLNLVRDANFAKDGEQFHIFATPSILLARGAFFSEEYSEALHHIEKALKNTPSLSVLALYVKIGSKLKSNDDIDKALIDIYTYHPLNDNEIRELISSSVELIEDGFYDKSLELLDWLDKKATVDSNKSFIFLNKILCYKLKKVTLTPELKDLVETRLLKAGESKNTWEAFGYAILSDNTEAILTVAELLSEHEMNAVLTHAMPIFTLINSDVYERLMELAIGKGFDVPEELIDEVDTVAELPTKIFDPSSDNHIDSTTSTEDLAKLVSMDVANQEPLSTEEPEKKSQENQ
ncbi:SIR2 family protein [Pantoea sp. GM_Pan_4]|uniref:SIR2 family protein n=1 Tax=Pantoea sp. GM_Pan_4 TaxID=2937389 RepID=UPI002269CE58|nr:SIR2 family protein [Pantoea sp. GM_Pan_4]